MMAALLRDAGVRESVVCETTAIRQHTAFVRLYKELFDILPVSKGFFLALFNLEPGATGASKRLSCAARPGSSGDHPGIGPDRLPLASAVCRRSRPAPRAPEGQAGTYRRGPLVEHDH